MRRSDRLTENALITQVTELQRDLMQFAGRQPSSLASGVLTYETKSPSTWDYQVTVGSDSETSLERVTTFTVDYTADGSQQFPNVRASALVRANDEATMPTLRSDGLYAWTDSNGRYLWLRGVWGKSQPIYWGDPLRDRFIFEVFTRKQVTIFFKALVAGTSPGTISVARTTT